MMLLEICIFAADCFAGIFCRFCCKIIYCKLFATNFSAKLFAGDLSMDFLPLVTVLFVAINQISCSIYKIIHKNLDTNYFATDFFKKICRKFAAKIKSKSNELTREQEFVVKFAGKPKKNC